MKKVIIYGAGSVGKVILEIINNINFNKKEYQIIGFLDDDESKYNTKFCGFTIFGNFEYLKKYDSIFVIITFSETSLREHCFFRLELLKSVKINYPVIIEPSVILLGKCTFGKGTILFPGVVIDPDSQVGDFCIINKCVTIGHDSVINDFITISPGVNIGGFNHIDKKSFLGIGSCTLQKIKIGKGAKIGAGSVVIKDVPDGAVVVGNPARLIKYNDK